MVLFPSTRWSLIRASNRQPGETAAAWVELVRDYRPAIVGFFRRRVGIRDAEDLAHEFLIRSMSNGWWSRADPDVGSFRRFLLMLLKRFLSTQNDVGYRRFESTVADVEQTHHGPTPERQFDLEFALCLTRTALAGLRSEYEDGGRADVFDSLQPWLAESPPHGEFTALGAKLGVAPNTLAVQLKRMRTRFQKSVRAALADLSIDAEQAARELDALRVVLGSDAEA